MPGPPTDSEFIDFGDLPPAIDGLLQQGVAAYRHDRALADALFRQALRAAPEQLPVYYCLYKIHTYQGNLGQALVVAEAGLREAAKQAGWRGGYKTWQPGAACDSPPGRFALYTLKALAFIHLKRGDPALTRQILGELSRLDPGGSVGWPVIADLALGCGTTSLANRIQR